MASLERQLVDHEEPSTDPHRPHESWMSVCKGRNIVLGAYDFRRIRRFGLLGLKHEEKSDII